MQHNRIVEWRQTQLSFSIHKRIEGGATLEWFVGTIPTCRFQYPQADRRGCNPLFCLWLIMAMRVSVSTSGSKGVQHQRFGLFIIWDELFQYPQADRRGCNLSSHSIPSVEYKLFQYPQADRRGCNRGGNFIENATVNVSVSTSGSKGVQLSSISALNLIP